MSLAGEAVVSIWHDIADEGRDEFYWWHLHEHMPERVSVPGFLRGRRYIAEEGGPEFFTLYEAQTLETLAGQDYLSRLNNPTPWTESTVRYFGDVARSIQRVRYSSGPGMGGYLMTVVFEVDDAATFVQRAHTAILTPVATKQGVAGVHLCQTDLGVSDTKTAEREKRDGGTMMPGWALMVETARRKEIDEVRQSWLGADACAAMGMRGKISTAIYRLEYTCTKNSNTP